MNKVLFNCDEEEMFHDSYLENHHLQKKTNTCKTTKHKKYPRVKNSKNIFSKTFTEIAGLGTPTFVSFCFLLIILLLFPPISSLSGDDKKMEEKEIFPQHTYDPEIPTPSEFLGYGLGAYHSTYVQMFQYFQELGRKSDRILFKTFGQSWERRPLYYAVMSTPANLTRLEEIKENCARLANPTLLKSRSETERVIETTPAVVFLNFGNDGNETASFESSIHMAYQLAAAADPEIKDLLNELIIIIIPAMNPDSHERFVSWYNANQVGRFGTADPHAAEHFAPWGMDTNNNHYQINLNRDSSWNTQPECQALVRLYREWNPHVFVDHHGQPVGFIGPWYSEPLNLEITDNQRDWLKQYGREMAEIFQKFNYRYTPWEFGLFYPGYWDAFPILTGAIAFTTESGGGGWKGLQLLLPSGFITTLRDGILQNIIADFSVLRLTAKNRQKKLRDYLAYKHSAIEESKRHPVQAYVFPPTGDPQRLEIVLNLMIRNGIEILRALEPFKIDQATSYLRGSSGSKSFATGSYLIPMVQTQSRLLRVLMEPDNKMPQEHINSVKEAHELSKTPGYINPNIWKTTELFYDVTAWSVPLTYDLECYRIPRMPNIKTEPVNAEIHPPGRFINSEAKFAYCFDYSSNRAIAAIGRLQKWNIKFRVASSPFQIGRYQFGRGATIVFRHENKDLHLLEHMRKLVKDTGITLLGSDRNLVDEGPHFGSDQYLEVVSGKVGLVMGGPVRPSSYGSLWFLFENVYDLPFTALDFNRILTTNLNKYNVLVFPDGFYSEINKATEEAIGKNLQRWVLEGGSLIGIKGAAAWLTKKNFGLTSIRLIGPHLGKSSYMTDGGHPPLPIPASDEDLKEESEPKSASVEQLGFKREPIVPGAIFRAKVYPQNYLSYGYEEEVPVLIWSSLVFSAGQEVAVPVRIAEENLVHIAGFAFPESVKRLAETPYLMDEKRGSGHVILYADDPNFRLYWGGLTRLFFNSILFSNSF